MKKKEINSLPVLDTSANVSGKPEQPVFPVNMPDLKKIKKKKRIKRFIIIGVIILVIAAVFILPSLFGSKQGANMSNYIEHTVARHDIAVSVNGTATVEPTDSYNVTALVKGEILEAPFEEGQVLKKGDLLYKIEAKDVENSISQAQIALKNAKISYNDTLDNISKLTVKAASGGKISKIYFDPGDTVSAGSVIADITDNQSMLLKLPFHTANAKLLSAGQSAVVTLTGTGENLSGTVDAVSLFESADNGGAVVSEVTIRVKNPGGLSEQTEATAMVGSIACSSSGKFTFSSKKSIVAETTGDVSALYKKEGDSVSSGDKILVMKNDTLSRQLEVSALSIKNSELTLKNAEDLLDNYEITAPISGTVIEKNFKVGDTIDPTTTTAASSLAVIYDMSALTFKMNIDELDIAKISVGQKVTITADAVDGKTFTGYIDKVNINGVTNNGVTSYPVTVKIENSDGLFPGMNISADITIEQVKDVIAIPVSAVMRGNLVTVKHTGTAKDKAAPTEQTVTLSLGKSDGNYIEVIDGLSEGDIIMIDTSTTSLMEQMMAGGGPMG